MMTKSEFAFRQSAIRFFASHEHCYFWTFTFTEVLCDWEYGRTWSAFMRELQDLYGGSLRGLRVLEVHKEHGLHYHALLNQRVYVGLVRRIGERYGIGRVHVKVANLGSIDYLAKYLGKQFTRENKIHAHIPRWGVVGGFKACRVQDVQIDGAYQVAIRAAQMLYGSEQLPYTLVRALRGSIIYHPRRLGYAVRRYRASKCLRAFAWTDSQWDELEGLISWDEQLAASSGGLPELGSPQAEQCLLTV